MYVLSIVVTQRPCAALVLVLCWVAALVIGVRARRIWLSLWGYHVVRRICPDLWSHGFLLSTLIVASCAIAADLAVGASVLIFAVGTNLFYAAGKMGCAHFGCCQFRSRGVPWNLPRYEAVACLIACALALPLAAVGHVAAGTLVATGAYSVVRVTSVALRRQSHRVLNFIDPIVAAMIAGYALLESF